MIITVCNEKGGVGKSTIAAHVAVRLAMTERSVLLIDADPQGTSYAWAIQRQKHRTDAPRVDCEKHEGNLIDPIKEAAKNYDYIVIDCGGADSDAMRSSMLVAHRAIIPVQVSRRDLITVTQMGSLIKDANERRKKPLVARILFNRANPLPSFWNRIDEAKEALEKAGMEVTSAVLKQRVAYDDSEYRGGTVYEGDDDKAKNEIERALKILLAKGE